MNTYFFQLRRDRHTVQRPRIHVGVILPVPYLGLTLVSDIGISSVRPALVLIVLELRLVRNAGIGGISLTPVLSVLHLALAGIPAILRIGVRLLNIHPWFGLLDRSCLTAAVIRASRNGCRGGFLFIMSSLRFCPLRNG